MSAPVYCPPALRALHSPHSTPHSPSPHSPHSTPRARWEDDLHRALVALLVDAVSDAQPVTAQPVTAQPAQPGALDTAQPTPVRCRP